MICNMYVNWIYTLWLFWKIQSLKSPPLLPNACNETQSFSLVVKFCGKIWNFGGKVENNVWRKLSRKCCMWRKKERKDHVCTCFSVVLASPRLFYVWAATKSPQPRPLLFTRNLLSVETPSKAPAIQQKVVLLKCSSGKWAMIDQRSSEISEGVSTIPAAPAPSQNHLGWPTIHCTII